ncbi:MAG: glycosyltransferase family 4 protein [Candidatus Niyogibacteria bacterium]|nr:glycosyltransferase family 4 protein [Candidatus Niyogibacteria bacterium]
MRKKLLIITQKVDRKDRNLGFFHRWLEEFAEYADLTVITSFIGDHALPANVRLYSFGKDRGVSRLGRIREYRRLYALHSREADAVFFHMVPEFVVAALPVILFRRHRTALWYVHGSVPLWLRLASRLVDGIFTASKESFRLASPKVIRTGHAIDAEFFRPAASAAPQNAVRLLVLGRISPVKKIEDIIEACARLSGVAWILSIVGGPLTSADEAYVKMLRERISEKDLKNNIVWRGAHSYGEMPAIYQSHDLFISMSGTGSVDKAVLEAMACGLTVITANEAFRGILPAKYFLESRDPQFLAERITRLMNELRPNSELRSIVEHHHSLSRTVRTIAERLLS